ncbi:MAG TPA: cupredoxin family copper-binding protein [Candidatus Acidoferrales bacterium]|nr:cupredoxin family copper-binding protein [Candidatus Acidoferrales bacterium]
MRISVFRAVSVAVAMTALAASAKTQQAHEHDHATPAISAPAIARGDAAKSQARAESAEVKIDNFSFGPQTLTVPAGTTVTWTNRDDIPHSVVSTEGAFKSRALDTDDKFSFTFAKAGTYSYFCGLHPKMTGKVVVQ